MLDDRVIFEKSKPGVRGVPLPACDVPEQPAEAIVGKSNMRKSEIIFPEVSEATIIRHFTNLSKKNVGVDTTFYPLGSCTMKYNPRVNERTSSLEGFAYVHPYEDETLVQGWLALMHNLEGYLSEISGLPAVSLQPAAGAHGELTGMKVISAYHKSKGAKRTNVLIPDTAHGTNPASAVLSGFTCKEIKSGPRGILEMDAVRAALDESTAAIMITNPNTLGLFEENIAEIAKYAHSKGALLYMDGANLNAILGLVRPGDIGVDVLHFNLHKTFSTPHGMGGPGSGPIAVRADLEKFLPVPRIAKDGDQYRFAYDRPDSIGRVKSFYGNALVMVKAYTYIRMLGSEGLNRVRENAVLNANYLASRLKGAFKLQQDRFCMHECVFAGTEQKKLGVRTLDMAKRLIDLGFHPPTIYFPLIVDEAIMIEPTETENKETLDAFAEAMLQIAREARETPDVLHNAPLCAPVGRLDEVKAAKEPVLTWRKQ
jgi:glycine dehydrogenase subunit 2